MAKGVWLILAASAFAVLGGCAGQEKRAQADLVQLSAWLPGYYDDQSQVRADQQAGRPAPESLRLAVVPVEAPVVGRHVFYLQESTGGRRRHVTMQRLASFRATQKGLVESLWSFTDPTRWLGADVTPELFAAMQPGDVRPMRGCNLTWTRVGGRFTASNNPRECRMVSRKTGNVHSIDMRIKLRANVLAIRAHAVGTREPMGGDAYIRFRRNGGPL